MVWNFMVTEYLRRSVRVEADSREEAYDMIVDAINNEDIVLDAEDFADRDIQTLSEYEVSMGGAGGDMTHDPDYRVDIDLREKTAKDD